MPVDTSLDNFGIKRSKARTAENLANFDLASQRASARPSSFVGRRTSTQTATNGASLQLTCGKGIWEKDIFLNIVLDDRFSCTVGLLSLLLILGIWLVSTTPNLELTKESTAKSSQSKQSVSCKRAKAVLQPNRTKIATGRRAVQASLPPITYSYAATVDSQSNIPQTTPAQGQLAPGKMEPELRREVRRLVQDAVQEHVQPTNMPYRAQVFGPVDAGYPDQKTDSTPAPAEQTTDHVEARPVHRAPFGVWNGSAPATRND